jgi:hypothetical protein
MKTTQYNPSAIEVEFAKIISGLKDQIQEKASGYQITGVEVDSQLDNPSVLFTLVDEDGDQHELLIRLIQRADPI